MAPALFSGMSCLSRLGRPRMRLFGPVGRLALITLACAGCAAPPIDWDPTRVVTMVAGENATLSAEGTLRTDTMVALAATVAPPSGPMCAGSLRVAAARRTLFAIWWAPRPDSGVRLLVARSGDGGRSWSAPAPVDTTDVGATGCRREPAVIAADTTSGYVHAAYA